MNKQSTLKIGLHNPESDRGLIYNIKNLQKIGCNFMQIFLHNPRSFIKRKKTKIPNTKYFLKKHKFNLVVHQPYVYNLCNHGIADIIYEIDIAEKMGAYAYVLHMGKHLNKSKESCLKLFKKRILEIAYHINKNNYNILLLLENSCGQGTEILYDFDELINFYESLNNKSIKLCIDTCHLYVSGYDLNNKNNIAKMFKYHKYYGLFHLNNSANPLGSHVDRHSWEIREIKNLIDIAKNIIKYNIPIIIEVHLSYNEMQSIIKRFDNNQ